MREEHPVSFWRAFRLLIGTAWRAGPLLTMAGVASELAVSLGHVGTLYGSKLIVDGATGRDFTTALRGALLISVATGARQICSWANTAIDLHERTAMRLEERVVEVAGRIPGIEHYERPDLLDHLELIREDRSHLGGVVQVMLGLIAIIGGILVSAVVLVTVHPALLLVMASGAVSMAMAGRVEKRLAAAAERVAEDHRLTVRLQELVLEPRAAAELRLHRLSDLILARHRVAGERVIAEETPAHLRALALDTAGALLFVGSQVGAIAAVVLMGTSGRLSVGEVVLGIGLVQRAAGSLNALIETVSSVLRSMRPIRHLAWLIDEADAVSDRFRDSNPMSVPRRIEQGIRLNDVSFGYPATEAMALSGIDLDLPAGTSLALVGENGAGKSTIVKLLLRLYDPTTGGITVDGTDLRRFPIEDWRLAASGAFQDHARFELVVREVVGIGDLPRIDDSAAIERAVADAGASDTIARLAQRLDTRVGPSFADGVELSGGQWQLLALARAMMRDEPLLLVLDEPTAALDPGREHALFERYAAAATDAAARTGGVTVLVSHRFSTVRMADRIAVVDGGRIVEYGTHDELMARAGLYAELFTLQARAYS